MNGLFQQTFYNNGIFANATFSLIIPHKFWEQIDINLMKKGELKMHLPSGGFIMLLNIYEENGERIQLETAICCRWRVHL